MKLYVVDEKVKKNAQILSNTKINKAGYFFREATEQEIMDVANKIMEKGFKKFVGDEK